MRLILQSPSLSSLAERVNAIANSEAEADEARRRHKLDDDLNRGVEMSDALDKVF